MRRTQGWRARLTGLIAATMLGSITLAGVAMADDVYNDLDASIDSTLETMNLTVPGANGTTSLKVQPRGGDGAPGCNLTRETTLTVTVVNSNPTVATVSPESVTFHSCDDLQKLTVTPVSPGTTTVSLEEKANTTDGSFNLAPASFTVIVTGPANTPPSVAVTGVDDGASYALGAVPVARCAVTDTEDGNSDFPATLSAVTGPYGADGIGSQVASCSYTDTGGVTVSASVTYHIVDLTPPVITHVLSPADPDGDNSWYTSNVGLTWTVSEPESPSSLVTTACVDESITTDQLETVYTCEATSAGGTADKVTVSIKRDATAPEVDLMGGPVGGGTYYFGDVPAAPTCEASDATSGLKGECAVSGYLTETGTHNVTAMATDNAGNHATATSSYTVKAWTLNGFYRPVEMGQVVNTVKAGSTVPLKFEVFAGEQELTSTSVVSSFTATRYTCDSSLPEDSVDFTTTGGTALRYDETGGQFIQNWQTLKSGAGSCFKVTMVTQDGSTITAQFKLK